MAQPEISIQVATAGPQLAALQTAGASKSKLAVHYVTPGEVITSEQGFLRGHGTYVEDGSLIASVSGVVERVNKLISVRPLRSRYTGEIGDVVVGRIAEVGQKRWKVDVNSRQDAVLQLSSINLPGGVQRRRTMEDELNMRLFFEEGDLISAEVQSFFADGALGLHTRSLKYGKLENGVVVVVPQTLVKRAKQHFHSLPELGVDVILGNNGFCWVAPLEKGEATREAREAVARVRNAIELLGQLFVAVYPQTIADVVEGAAARGLSPAEMLRPEHALAITERARSRREVPEGASAKYGEI